jgi:hypothetical protein
MTGAPDLHGDIETPLLGAPDAEQESRSSDSRSDSRRNAQISCGHPRLTWPLRFLFALNGFTLAFPMLALMYVLNTRVSMPIHLLPTYGAVAFLPCSLKPIYCYLSSYVGESRRDVWICVLLIATAFATAITAWIPRDGVLLCFTFAFFRGVATSWPELLLGLTLIDQAYSAAALPGSTGMTDGTCIPYETTAALFQSQAATSRNVGSLVASVAALAIFTHQQYRNATPMNEFTATILLVMTGTTNLVGAAVAWIYHVGVKAATDGTDIVGDPLPQAVLNNNGSDQEGTQDETKGAILRQPSYDSCYSNGEHALTLDEQTECIARGSCESERSLQKSNTKLVILLQVTIILIGLRQPIVEGTTSMSWGGMLMMCILGLTFLGYSAFSSVFWKPYHSAGLFLILKSAAPSASFLLSSYMYVLFESMPAFLQFLSVIDNLVVTLSSWTYGKLWSGYSQGEALLWLMTGTTILASMASLSNIALVTAIPAMSSVTWKFGVTLAIKGLTTFLDEWCFLPEVVLATVAAVDYKITIMAEAQLGQNFGDGKTTNGIRYGTLVACLDLGGQLGAILMGPLVLALNVSRENDWKHLDQLIWICSLFGLLSVTLVGVLR